jgi:surface carbohydrate biosynthesis protein
MKIHGRTVWFSDPESSDIVIFDECNSHYVRKIIDSRKRITVFKQRPEELYIGPKTIFMFLLSLHQLKFSNLTLRYGGFFTGIRKQLRFLYNQSSLLIINPEAVVTLIDNNELFCWLSKTCRKLPFISIQNGSRLSYAAGDNKEYHSQHFFCFGEHEKCLFPKLGYKVENFYPVGSLIASLHFDYRISNQYEKYDLLVVSTWRGNIGFPEDVRDMMQSMRIMDQLLARYIRSKSIRSSVILRSERGSEHWFMPEIGVSEEDYYREIYGNSIEILETNLYEHNIFPIIQQSHLIVSCLSTALLEAYGIGKKILYCNFTGTNIYHCDLDSKIVTEESDWEKFSDRLDDLLAKTPEDYNRLHRETMKYYMSFPEQLATYDIIANKINEIVNNK